MRFYKLGMDSAGVQRRWHVMQNISMLLAVSFALQAQTTINGGRIFKGTVDASGAVSTLPHRTGTGSPAGRDACARAGETYFQLDGTGGQNLWACTVAGTPGTWTAASGGLADTGSNGLVVRTASGATTPRALTAGAGMICVNGDGVAGNPTCSPDTAIILSRSTAQSGADTTCKPANMSATAPTCGLATALLTYTAGAPLQFCPDTTAGTAPVLNVNGLGPLTFKKLVGSSLVNLAAGDYVAGACYGLILGAGTPPASVILEPADKIISAQGDLITGDANGVPIKLAIGGNLTVLTSNGTSASWASAAGAVSSVNTMTGAVNLPDLSATGQVTAAHFAAPLPVAQGGTGVATSTGTGNTVRSTSPTLVTPVLGTPASGVMTNVTGLPLTTGVTGTLPVANGGTGVVTSTGTGATVLSTSPTLVTPALGTPASGVATNITGLPLTTGVTGTLPVANGGTGTTTAVGIGSTVLNTSPTLVTPLLGTPTSGVMTNVTGLPLTTGVTGVLPEANGGTGSNVTPGAAGHVLRSNATHYVDAAIQAGDIPTLNQNTTGTAANLSGTPTLPSGTTLVAPALGTPASGVMTNVTGLPLTTGVTGVLPVANGGTGTTTSVGIGSIVLNASPVLVTPLLGTPASGVLTNTTGLPLTTGVTGTLPVANGGTGVTTSTGTGATVLSTSPTLVTPALGTPASGVMTNVTGLPLTTGVTGVLPVANGGAAFPDTASRNFEYLMQEQTGTTLTDTSGNSNTCTFGAAGAAPVWVRSRSVSGVQFAGSQRCVMGTSVWSTTHTWFFAIHPNAFTARSSVSLGFNAFIWGDTANQYFYIPSLNGGIAVGTGATAPATFGSERLTGTVIVAVTWTGTTQHVYVNGAEIGYVKLDGTHTQTSSTNTYLGDGVSLGGGYGFRGVMAYAAGYSTTYTAAQVASNTAKIGNLLLTEGIPWDVRRPHMRHCYFDGDSLTDNGNNGPYWNSSYERYALDTLPFPCDASNFALSGELFNNIQINAPAVIDPVISSNDADPNVCSILAGINDLDNSISGATTYGYATSYTSGRRTAGCKNVVITVGPNVNLTTAQRTEKNTYNTDIRTNWLSGSLQADAVADFAGDPNIGCDGCDANAGFFAVAGLHPKDLGNRLLATYVAPALARAAGTKDNTCFVLTVGVNVGTTKWTLDVNHSGTPADILTLAAALTQDVPLYYVGAKYTIAKTRVTTTTAFTGTATLTTSIGDSVGGNTFYDANVFDLKAAVSNTNFHDADPNVGASLAGSLLQLHVISTTNNIASISAGAVDVTVCVSNIP